MSLRYEKLAPANQDVELGPTTTPPRNAAGTNQAPSTLTKTQSVQQLLAKSKSLNSPIKPKSEPSNASQPATEMVDREFEYFQQRQKSFLAIFEDKKSDKPSDRKPELKVQNLFAYGAKDAAEVLKLLNSIQAINRVTHAKAAEHRYFDAIIEFLLEIQKMPACSAKEKYLQNDFLAAVKRVNVNTTDGQPPVDLKNEITDVKIVADKMNELLKKLHGADLLRAANELFCDTEHGGREIFRVLDEQQLAALGDEKIQVITEFMAKSAGYDSSMMNVALAQILQGITDAKIANAPGLTVLNENVLASIDTIMRNLKPEAETKDNFATKKLTEFSYQKLAEPSQYRAAIESIVKTHTALMHLESLKIEVENLKRRIKSVQGVPPVANASYYDLLATAGRDVLTEGLKDIREIIATNDLDVVKLETIATIAERTAQAVANPSANTFNRAFEYAARAQTFSNDHLSLGLKRAFAVLALTLLAILTIVTMPLTNGVSLKVGLALGAGTLGVAGLLINGKAMSKTHQTKIAERASKITPLTVELNFFSPKSDASKALFASSQNTLESPRIGSLLKSPQQQKKPQVRV